MRLLRRLRIDGYRHRVPPRNHSPRLSRRPRLLFYDRSTALWQNVRMPNEYPLALRPIRPVRFRRDRERSPSNYGATRPDSDPKGAGAQHARHHVRDDNADDNLLDEFSEVASHRSKPIRVNP
jgi:hypothetical protein